MTLKTNLIVLAFLLLCTLKAEEGFSLKSTKFFLRNFQVNGNFDALQDKARKKETALSNWTVSGKRALIQEELCKLYGFQMEIDSAEQGKIALQSPYCDFFRTTEEIKSNAAVLVQAEGLQITGLGYDVYRHEDKIMLVIRSTVQIHFNKKKMKLPEGSKLW